MPLDVNILYGSENCSKCKVAQKRFPNAAYKLLKELSADEYKSVFDKAAKANVSALPIALDSDGNIIMPNVLGL